MFVVVLTATKSFAAYGWYNASMTIGGVTTDFTQWSTSGDSPTDLGVVTNMTITSIAFNVWSDNNDRGGANMYFRIWDGGSSQVGDDQNLFLGTATRITTQENHDFSISWTGTEDLANAVGLTLEAGKTYYIDMYAKTYGGDPNVDNWYSGNNSSNYHAKLTITNSYTRTVTSGNYGTICLPYAATISGAEVYEISGKVMSGKTLTGINLSSVTGGLTAGVAYIFKATSSTLTATLSGSYTDAVTGGYMEGNLGATTKAPIGSYVISGNKIHKVVDGGSGVNIGQYKGWINMDNVGLTSARSANFISFEDNSTTGITNLNVNDIFDNDAPIYNLAGQRVNKSYKGVVIVNGKKMLNK